MAKIYDKEGNKMGLAGICKEIVDIATKEQADVLTSAIRYMEADAGVPDSNHHRAFAHAVLDTYHQFESTTEQGARFRKLTDNLMTKYQKSTTPTSAEDQKIYGALIEQLFEISAD